MKRVIAVAMIIGTSALMPTAMAQENGAQSYRFTVGNVLEFACDGVTHKIAYTGVTHVVFHYMQQDPNDTSVFHFNGHQNLSQVEVVGLGADQGVKFGVHEVYNSNMKNGTGADTSNLVYRFRVFGPKYVFEIEVTGHWVTSPKGDMKYDYDYAVVCN